MKTCEVEVCGSRLESFLEEVTASMGRKDRRYWAEQYVRGLLLDGERKSIEPMVERLGPGADVQSLRQFVSQSPWDCLQVQAAMAKKASQLWPVPLAWEIDETSFPKAGHLSVGVARQYCGALGKVANCQVAVTLHYVGENLEGHTGSAALGWRLFLPRDWSEDPARRAQAHVPEEVCYRTRNQLALELVREALERGLPKAPILADSDYGDDYGFRAALRQMGCAYAVAVEPRAKAWVEAPPELAPGERRRAGTPMLPLPRPLEEIARSLPAGSYRMLTFREGTKGPLRGRFARVALWAAHGYTQGQHRSERAREWLLVEWPREAEAPLKYWLLWLEPQLGAHHAAPRLREMALLAKRRFQVEQDYRELKEELGLDHYEGRHWSGWHHHVTLAAMAHLFLGAERQRLAKQRRRRTQKKPARPRRSTTGHLHSSYLAADPTKAAGYSDPTHRPMSLVPRLLPAPPTDLHEQHNRA
jgi:SRSO17 transposase